MAALHASFLMCFAAIMYLRSGINRCGAFAWARRPKESRAPANVVFFTLEAQGVSQDTLAQCHLLYWTESNSPDEPCRFGCSWGQPVHQGINILRGVGTSTAYYVSVECPSTEVWAVPAALHPHYFTSFPETLSAPQWLRGRSAGHFVVKEFTGHARPVVSKPWTRAEQPKSFLAKVARKPTIRYYFFEATSFPYGQAEVNLVEPQRWSFLVLLCTTVYVGAVEICLILYYLQLQATATLVQQADVMLRVARERVIARTTFCFQDK
uniref:Putative transmembrane protein n=1 Tax=Toxoplasma gondii COUG TaxID=1074873 RepID=A0A2G8XPW6_TOXGO|nr:putative transmembrane protein [Toxoplasma gondii COUG]